jgi:hypothetical protein
VLERAQLVRVGVDRDLHAGLCGEPRLRISQIESVRL